MSVVKLFRADLVTSLVCSTIELSICHTLKSSLNGRIMTDLLCRLTPGRRCRVQNLEAYGD